MCMRLLLTLDVHAPGGYGRQGVMVARGLWSPGGYSTLSLSLSLSLSLKGKTFINVTIYSIQIVKGGLPPSPVYIMPYKGIAQLVHK